MNWGEKQIAYLVCGGPAKQKSEIVLKKRPPLLALQQNENFDSTEIAI